MNLRHFVRMAKWARHPPSAKRVMLVFGVILFCAVLAAFEWWFGWPDWLTLDRARPRFDR